MLIVGINRNGIVAKFGNTERSGKVAEDPVNFGETVISTINELEDAFYNKAKAWRKGLNRIQGQLIGCADIARLQTSFSELESCMMELTSAHQALGNVLPWKKSHI